jgi:hypothetical protein
MKRSWPWLCALFAGFGCATESDKAQWAEAMKELRGDNIQMGSGGFSKAWAMDDHALDPKPRDLPPASK